MPTPKLPASGTIDLASIAQAFPGLGDPPNILQFIDWHPSLPATGGPYPMDAFYGLSAVSPTFAFASSVGLTNGSVTSQGASALSIQSPGVSASLPATGTLSLASYVQNARFQGTLTFAVAGGASLPAGLTLSPDGTLAISVTSPVSSSTDLLVTNRWGNTTTITLGSSFASAIAPTPSCDAAQLQYSLDGSGKPFFDTNGNLIAVIHLTVSNTTSLTFTSSGFSSLPYIATSTATDYYIYGGVKSATTFGLAVTLTNNVGGGFQPSQATASFLWQSPALPHCDGATLNYLQENGVNSVNASGAILSSILLTVSNTSSLSFTSTGFFSAPFVGSSTSTSYYLYAYVKADTTVSLTVTCSDASGGSTVSTFTWNTVHDSGSIAKTMAVNSWGYQDPAFVSLYGNLFIAGNVDGVNTYNLQQFTKFSAGSLAYPGAPGFKSICRGVCFAAVDGYGALHAWGLNYNGLLGNGTNVDTGTPSIINGGSLSSKTIKKVVVGGGTQAMLILDTNGVLHGTGTASPYQGTYYPAVIPGFEGGGGIDVAMMNAYALSIASDNTVQVIDLRGSPAVAAGYVKCSNPYGPNDGQVRAKAVAAASGYMVIIGLDGSCFRIVPTPPDAGNWVIAYMLYGGGAQGATPTWFPNPIVKVACGSNHTVYLDSAGLLYYNGTGASNGDGTSNDAFGSAVALTAGSLLNHTFHEIGCDQINSYAIDENNNMHVWGPGRNTPHIVQNLYPLYPN